MMKTIKMWALKHDNVGLIGPYMWHPSNIQKDIRIDGFTRTFQTRQLARDAKHGLYSPSSYRLVKVRITIEEIE